MGLFSIDKDKCVQAGFCAEECPTGLVRMDGPDKYPTPLEGKEHFCVQCGHCVAVCPHDAITLDAMPLDDFALIREDLVVSPEQAEQFIKSRRSIRSYKKKPVEREILSRLVDGARFAPSGHNMQPVEWVVLASRESVIQLVELVVEWSRLEAEKDSEVARELNAPGLIRAWERGKDVICRGAPHLIAAHAAKSAMTPDLDAVIATAHLELLAHGFGLGACWAGYVLFAARNHPPILEFLSIPKDHDLHGALMLGRPKYKYHRIPPRREAGITWI